MNNVIFLCISISVMASTLLLSVRQLFLPCFFSSSFWNTVLTLNQLQLVCPVPEWCAWMQVLERRTRFLIFFNHFPPSIEMNGIPESKFSCWVAFHQRATKCHMTCQDRTAHPTRTSNQLWQAFIFFLLFIHQFVSHWWPCIFGFIEIYGVLETEFSCSVMLR